MLLSVMYEIILSDSVINICSMSCAEADWESSHSLLCTGASSDPRRKEALLKFVKHANGKIPLLSTSIIFNNPHLLLTFLFHVLPIYLISFSHRYKWYIPPCCKGRVSFCSEFLFFGAVWNEKWSCANTHTVYTCVSDNLTWHYYHQSSISIILQ